jgi:hypothetical protein
VGNSRKGEKFVRELESDDTIKDILHCSPGSLDRWQEEFQTPGSEDKYTGMVSTRLPPPLFSRLKGIQH